MMKYNKLFALLAIRGMKKSDLVEKKVISSPTLAKLSKGESITTTVLCKICDFLECQPGDIMEYIKDEQNGSDESRTLKRGNGFSFFVPVRLHCLFCSGTLSENVHLFKHSYFLQKYPFIMSEKLKKYFWIYPKNILTFLDTFVIMSL